MPRPANNDPAVLLERANKERLRWKKAQESYLERAENKEKHKEAVNNYYQANKERLKAAANERNAKKREAAKPPAPAPAPAPEPVVPEPPKEEVKPVVEPVAPVVEKKKRTRKVKPVDAPVVLPPPHNQEVLPVVEDKKVAEVAPAPAVDSEKINWADASVLWKTNMVGEKMRLYKDALYSFKENQNAKMVKLMLPYVALPLAEFKMHLNEEARKLQHEIETKESEEGMKEWNAKPVEAKPVEEPKNEIVQNAPAPAPAKTKQEIFAESVARMKLFEATLKALEKKLKGVASVRAMFQSAMRDYEELPLDGAYQKKLKHMAQEIVSEN